MGAGGLKLEEEEGEEEGPHCLIHFCCVFLTFT